MVLPRANNGPTGLGELQEVRLGQRSDFPPKIPVLVTLFEGMGSTAIFRTTCISL
eukprot:CAMPEP_0114624792 /NCGR_PEP_ID=MMETSP0168-20121206/10944_1 /TAXON_ID=95228 ORGANISM="Vannella sp., Strain DIVA3 517/6/12" /NCGR_SAMPLE_ID=MMETSP0168 /ASSEMBLY_ACC=CAM_ASM_000044 /LENGTH=54 /DNA_ID=CAMNT_0001836067 /DNA_START=263 /DNA_END=424 /DNA_ORIENTATION=+